jgi:AcrR family transcriptional regulator
MISPRSDLRRENRRAKKPANWSPASNNPRESALAKAAAKDPVKPRERLLDAAYDLFARNGISQVGIDTILAKSGCAKASLYGNFKSKVDLAIAFLDRREAVWTRGWLAAEIKRRASTPDGQLLAIFDVFDGWFRKKTFEGCSFINVLLESSIESPVRRAAAIHLSRIRAIIHGLAKEAHLRDPAKFAQAWHMLMKGSIISAGEGNKNAARDAKHAARLILDGWERKPKLLAAPFSVIAKPKDCRIGQRTIGARDRKTLAGWVSDSRPKKRPQQ